MRPLNWFRVLLPLHIPQRTAPGLLQMRRDGQPRASALCRALFTALLLFTGLLVAAPSQAAILPTVLTSARQVHDLPKEQALQAIPVHFVATVTYYQPEEENLFVADSTGGVFLWGEPRSNLHPGDVIEITGVSRPSLRTVVLVTAPLRVLSSGRQVEPVSVDYRTFLAGDVDCQFVSIRATVRSASLERHGTDTVAQLQLLMPGGLVQAYVQDYSGLDLNSLIDAEIQVSGVAGAAYNAVGEIMRPRLLTNSASGVHVLSRPSVSAWQLPMTPISDIEKSRHVLNLSHRVRVQGVVTAYDPGYSIVIQHGNRSLSVVTRQVSDIHPGSVVDVTGFPDDHAYAAVLEDAQFLILGGKEQIQPRPVSYTEAISGANSDDLVEMRGTVLSQLHSELTDTVMISVDQHPVDLVLRRTGNKPLPSLPVGAVVTARGICRVTPSIEWKKPLLFRVDLRDSSDLTVVTRPSWWTVRHLFIVLGGVTVASLIFLSWGVLLQRRVRKQTQQICHTVLVERERSHLLELINSETPLNNLLTEICTSINALVTTARCSVRVLGPAGMVAYEITPEFSIADAYPVFRKDLLDNRGQRIALFCAFGPEDARLDEESRATLEAAADLVNVALNQRRLFEELNHSSTHDQLTNLPNRRRCNAHMEAVMQQAMRANSRMGVAYIDIDRFKSVNDRFGHKIGDLYLQVIAERLGNNIKKSDLLARVGGDEFLLVASDLRSVADAATYKARLQSCFDDLFHLDGVDLRGAASIGVAVFPDHGQTMEDLKRYADADMYKVKRSHHGRATDANVPRYSSEYSTALIS